MRVSYNRAIVTSLYHYMPRLTINRIIRMRLYRELAGIYRINGLDNEVCVVYVQQGVDMADMSLRVVINRVAYRLRENIAYQEYIVSFKQFS